MLPFPPPPVHPRPHPRARPRRGVLRLGGRPPDPHPEAPRFLPEDGREQVPVRLRHQRPGAQALHGQERGAEGLLRHGCLLRRPARRPHTDRDLQGHRARLRLRG